jgi:hypothetical protein
MDSPTEKTMPDPIPEETSHQGLPEKRSPSGDPVDIASLATLPDALFEAGVHLAIDELHEQSLAHPLEALGGLLGLMFGLNSELLKTYAPPIITNAHNAATEAMAMQKPVVVSKEQSRALTSMLRIQESLVKLGAARVKVGDEMARRRRSGGV